MRSERIVPLILGLLLLFGGCTMRPTVFMHPDYNFGFVDRVAVIPLENLTDDRGAGARMTRHIVSELLAAEAFDIVEPGEVTNAMSGVGQIRVAELTVAQVKDLGGQLQAKALFLGSVTESSTQRAGTSSKNIVTLNLRLVETETAQVIWSTTVTEAGRGFWASLFGTSGSSMGEVSRRAARHAIARLLG